MYLGSGFVYCKVYTFTKIFYYLHIPEIPKSNIFRNVAIEYDMYIQFHMYSFMILFYLMDWHQSSGPVGDVYGVPSGSIRRMDQRVQVVGQPARAHTCESWLLGGSSGNGLRQGH